MPTLDEILKNVSIDQNISSYHWNRDNQKKNNYNEINPGFGLEYKDDDMRYMAGNYLNSLGKNSNYLLAGYTPLNKFTDLGKFSGGLVCGGITGYPTGNITPALGLLGSYENGKFGLNLLAVPNVKISGKDVDGFLGIQSKYKF